LRDPTLAVLIQYRRVTDGRTDWRTNDDSIYCTSIAWRGKNWLRELIHELIH